MSLRPPITIYTKSNCPNCDKTKKFAQQRGIEYEEFNVEENEAALQFIKEMGYLQVPVVVVPFYDGQTQVHWSGLRPDLLVQIPKV